MSSPLVLLPSGRKSHELTTLDTKPNFLGFLHARYLCRTHNILESFRMPILQISPKSTRWKKLRKPFFRIYFKHGLKCMIFEKVLVGSRAHDLAVKQAVDFMFTLMRRETTLSGSLSAWFENKRGQVEYKVKREEEGDD